ncbi:DUF63 family protein [Halorubellus sp. PRR65]|uniref:DUF63 family protein n=1 Tax=Halorubellus sp. PRR65 TaxID=3098148 RepID=UPI002B25991B|nr:DUF63 family protein [Halorubellus sp. PRR65]
MTSDDPGHGGDDPGADESPDADGPTDDGVPLDELEHDAATEFDADADTGPAERGFLDRLGVSMFQAWLAAVAGLFVVFGLGSVAFTRTIYANFVWHYFWGPVYADAQGWRYAAWADGEQVQVSSADVAANMGPVAEPGYTIYSEVGYAVILLVMLVGVALLLRRLELTRYRALFYALFPFVPLGGALRVLEDANNVLPPEASAFALDYPLNTLFISPIIYFTMFFLTLATLLLALWVHRRGFTSTFEYPLAAMGTTLLVLTVGAVAALSFTTDLTTPPRLRFYPLITVLTLVFATLSTAGVWGLIRTFAPQINEGTGYMGLVIIWGQAVDGVSNVIGLDWYDELVPVATADLDPKHPVNKFVQDFTGQVLPESITAITGDAWTFLLVKLVAAVFVVWVFDEQIFEESPRFTFMLLLAILAVGLGPGTRDMLRATFLV